MSHPVFLTSSQLGHMPIGSLNQWHDFYCSASYELEADGFIPLLWLLLFSRENIQWAKYSDDFDTDHVNAETDFTEVQDNSEESQFAYLVISQQHALANLESRKHELLNIMGNDYASEFLNFQALIKQHFPAYILLRTSGLSLDPDDAEFLEVPLFHIETLSHPQSSLTEDTQAFWEFIRQDMQRYEDKKYFLYGSNSVMLTHPNMMLHEESAVTDQNTSETPSIQNAHASHINEQNSEPQSALSSWMVWICTAIVVLATLAVYFTTQSALYSAVVFFVSAFILGFISSKMGQENTKQPD